MRLRPCLRPGCTVFITNRVEPLEQVEAEHRQHAVVEITIRDLKDQALALPVGAQPSAEAAAAALARISPSTWR